MKECSMIDCGKVARKGTLCYSHNYQKRKARVGPEYAVWRTMIARCHNPNTIGYKGYGAKGIGVCLQWKNSFDTFITDMGKRPTSEHSIERIDSKGDYEPSNCKWATAHEQMTNRSNNNPVPGVCYDSHSKRWVARLTIKGKLVYYKNFKYYNDAVQARKEAEVNHLGATL